MTTIPYPQDWPNKPWSPPPCPNDSPDGLACTMVAHLVRYGQRQHCAQVRDPLIRWVSWYTTEPQAHKASGNERSRDV